MSGTTGPELVRRFRDLWATLTPIGRHERSGGYLRLAWSPPELACRDWFAGQAAARDLPVESDGNGNLWARWLPPGLDPATPAVVTGSHLDSVPHGGGYDGPLGIVSAFLAIDELRRRGFTPRRPITVAAFAEEEGARFGVACLGSRLLTGAIDPAQALALRDRSGVSLAEAMAGAGADPDEAGPDPDRLARIAAFVELHIEQGRGLVGRDAPVGVADAIWPHGRWRLDVTGEANHAGTTRMVDRRDPMLTYAYAVLAADEEARRAGAHATIGRVSVEPNATNAIAYRVQGWLDARADDAATLDGLVAAISTRVAERAGRDGTTVIVTMESASPPVVFDPRLARRLATVLAAPAAPAAGPGRNPVPVLPTGAGHDAGILAAHLPTAMLFVRNPTGVSHAPAEAASDADCAAGVLALATVLTELTGDEGGAQ